jgi:hypothetical protein
MTTSVRKISISGQALNELTEYLTREQENSKYEISFTEFVIKNAIENLQNGSIKKR